MKKKSPKEILERLGAKTIRHINKSHENYIRGMYPPPLAGREESPKNRPKDFFEITPEMTAYLDIHLGRDLIRVTKEAQHIFKLDNNKGYMLLMTWANDRFRTYGNPTVNNLLPTVRA